jgi:hypothetical protein
MGTWYGVYRKLALKARHTGIDASRGNHLYSIPFSRRHWHREIKHLTEPFINNQASRPFWNQLSKPSSTLAFACISK